uniref:Mucin like 3 n=1 Tax=Molossus molossus TaxID=27622 RepID=A0A7J8GRG3_MOLMO|nr:mucin like 3 [Molossus molossus]
MARLAHCVRCSLGLQYCLLFLLAAREAGAATLQEHPTSESPTPNHLPPPTPDFAHRTPSDHTALHLGHNHRDPHNSAETHQPKHHCNATRHSRPRHKPLDNPQSSMAHQEAPATSEQNPSNQGKDPVIRNGRSAGSNNTHKKSSDATTKPKSKTTCHTSKTSKRTVNRNTSTTGTSSENTSITSHSKSTKTLSRHTVNSGTTKKPTSSSDKSTTYKASDNTKNTTESKERVDKLPVSANYTTTVVSDKTLIKTRGHPKEIQSTTEKNKQTQATPTYHGQKTILADVKTTKALTMLTDHEKHSTSAHEKMHTKKTTYTKRKTTPIPAMSTENPGRTTATTEPIKSSVKVTGEKSVTSSIPRPNKTHQVPTGTFTFPTSSVELSSVTSEAPANKSHPYQNKDGSQGGLHVGERGDSDSFPAWAIVIVVLVAVILLLVFLGLIFLVSYMTRTRRALIHSGADDEPEDEGGPNSYPVYLMEQQTLGVGQIPSPR